jgi:hypothetical protein
MSTVEYWWWKWGDAVKFFGAVVVGLFGVKSCADSDWYQKQMSANAAARTARETPHVIREKDGCKVYAFERDGRDHYFTRCGEVVTTETNWTQSCGKNCSKQVSDIIETRGNK